jgi:hypothetical protein
MKKILSALLVASLPAFASAQSTLQSVGDIFQANCTVGCHSGPNPNANLDLSGGPAALRAALVGVTPTNPAAATKGYKLVDAGYPDNSFLLYKCATPEWDDQFGMDVAEGGTMPSGLNPSLEKEEIELIRQWIVYGAKQNGTIVDPQILDDFYNDNGMARVEKPDAPAPEDGFQMHLGPFFLAPGTEVEFYKKEQLLDNNEQNVVRFEGYFNDESHHFLLFELDEATAAGEDEGLRPVGIQNAFQNPYMVGWVDPDVLELPAGTAYKIDENSMIDLNYHIINYASNGDSILAAEVYINFITENNSPELIEMQSDLMINLGIFIPNNGSEVSFEDAVFDNTAGATDSMYVWFLSSHTHKYGTDYDIYKRNPDGSRGDQLYEGYYDTEYTFNQGYYDWEHPGNLYLDEVNGELLPIALKDGLIQEATYQIPGSAGETSQLITFGLTTDDEMMLAFIQYTLEPLPVSPNGIFDGYNEPSFMSVYPNPTNGQSYVQFDLSDNANVQLNVYNSLGQEVKNVYSGQHSAGPARFEIDTENSTDPNGLYLIQLNVDGKIYTERLMHLKR